MDPARQLSRPASRATYLGAPSPLYRALSTGRPLQRLRRSAAVAFSRSASPAAGLTSAKWSEPMRHDPARHPWRPGGQPGGVRCRARFISRHKRAWDDPSTQDVRRPDPPPRGDPPKKNTILCARPPLPARPPSPRGRGEAKSDDSPAESLYCSSADGLPRRTRTSTPPHAPRPRCKEGPHPISHPR